MINSTHRKAMMPKTTLYLSGPMRGRKNNNREAFDNAAKDLRALGYTVYSPTEIADAHGVDLKSEPTIADLRRVFAQDILHLARADQVVLIEPGHDSLGTHIELQIAAYLNIPVRSLND